MLLGRYKGDAPERTSVHGCRRSGTNATRKAMRRVLDTMRVEVPKVSEVHAHTVMPPTGAKVVVVKEPVAWWESLRRFRNRRRRQQGKDPIEEFDPDHVSQMVETWAFKNRRWRDRCQDGEGVYVPFRDICQGDRAQLTLDIADRLNAPVWEEKGWWPSNRVSYRRGGTVTEEEWAPDDYLQQRIVARLPDEELQAIAASIERLPFEVEALAVQPPECVMP